VSTAFIGAPVNRVDGPEKVSGAAKYTAELALPQIAYAVIVGASLASGRVTGIDTHAAESADGVLGILTQHNTPKVAAPPHLLP
jgi:xanthine dehydrogenase YagR molybdenum-binding subunit